MISISKRSRAWFRGAVSLLVLTDQIAQAAPPTWWSTGSPPVINSSAVSNNSALANIGQAKWMAKSALAAVQAVNPSLAAEISSDLVGPGKPITSWSAPTTQAEIDAQKAPLLVGQLKAIAAPFYTRIHAHSPAWLANERIINGIETYDGIFPWTDSTSDDVNGAPATLGQLKAVFALHFTEDANADGISDFTAAVAVEQGGNPPEESYIDPNLDTDGDGLPDVWELAHQGNPNSTDQNNNGTFDAYDDDDGDGSLNISEMEAGTDPNNASDFPPELVFAEVKVDGQGHPTNNSPRYIHEVKYTQVGVHTYDVGPFPLSLMESKVTALASQIPTDPNTILQLAVANPAILVRSTLSNCGSSDSHSKYQTDDFGAFVSKNIRRFWLHAPAKSTAQTFNFLKLNYQVVTETYDTGYSETRTDQPSEVVTFTVPANATYSSSYDLKTAAPSDSSIDAINYTRLVYADIAGDTNRDGYAKWAADRAGKSAWTNQQGAIYNVNFDSDRSTEAELATADPKTPDAIGFDNDGNGYAENWLIENERDARDMAPLQVMPMILPEDYKVFLRVDHQEGGRAVHVYKSATAGEQAIWGSYRDPSLPSSTNDPAPPWVASQSSPGATEIEITKWVNMSSADYEAVPGNSVSKFHTFGIEGLVLKGMKVPGGRLSTDPTSPDYGKFSGEILFSLKIVDKAGTVVADNWTPTRMRVAPWLMINAQEKAEKVYSTPYAGLNDAFMSSAVNGFYTGLGRSGILKPVAGDTQWTQDHVEIGYTQRPGGPATHLTFQVPYEHDDGVPLPDWPLVHLLGPDMGVFNIGQQITAVGGRPSANFGGNLEVLSPTTQNPLGVAMMGDIADPVMKSFLNAQKYQTTESSFSAKSDWLNVGHIDEYSSFLPGNRVAMADSDGALHLLQTQIPSSDRANYAFFTLTPDLKKGALIEDTWDTDNPGTSEDDRMILHTNLPHSEVTQYQWIRFYSGHARGFVARVRPFGTAGDLEVVPETRTLYNPNNRDELGNPASLGVTEERRCIWYTGRTMDYYHKFAQVPIEQNTWTRSETPGDGFGESTPPDYNATPRTGDLFVLVKDTKHWAPGEQAAATNSSAVILNQGCPAFITVKEVLEDALFYDLNHRAVRNEVEDGKDAILAAGGSGVHFVSLPALYFGTASDFDGGVLPPLASPTGEAELVREGAFAFVPGAANLQYLNGVHFVPRQFAPVVGDPKKDIFETSIRANLGLATYFVDDWELYHRLEGQVHCGSAVKRKIPAAQWWKQIVSMPN